MFNPIPLICGLLICGLAFIMGYNIVDRPWGTECTVEWCKPQPKPKPITDGDIFAFGKGSECYKPEAFKGIPNTAIVADLKGQLHTVTFDQAWEQSAKGQVWVLRLCK